MIRKPVPTDRKRLRTCSVSCPDLTNPMGNVLYSKVLPPSEVGATALAGGRSGRGPASAVPGVSGALHRSVSSDAFTFGSVSAYGVGYTDASVGPGGVSGSRSSLTRAGFSDSKLTSLYEEDAGQDESRAKKYVCCYSFRGWKEVLWWGRFCAHCL